LCHAFDHAFTIADKSTVRVLGKANINLTIGTELFEHSFHVVSNLSVNINLGDDFLEMNDVVIHRGQKTFSLLNGMVQVPLCTRGPPQIMAITPYEVTIQPNSQQILQVQFSCCRTNKVLMLEPLDNENALGIRVARTLVSVHGKFFCPVWNNSDEPMTLPFGTPIATVFPIKDILRFVSDKESTGSPKITQSRADRKTRTTYAKHLSVLNTHINTYNKTSSQNDARNATRHFYASDARHSYASNARQAYGNGHNTVNNNCSVTQPEEKVHHTIHHNYKKLNLK